MACLLATILAILLFRDLAQLWREIEPLEGLAFLSSATLLGGALAIAPLTAAASLLLCVWHGVESVFLPRSHPTPTLDNLIVAGGMLVWFSPCLAALGAGAMALVTGRIHFSRPPRDYFLATDPIAFWQGVGFWIIVAASFGYVAWRYWQGKLRRPRSF
ncbi:MAG: hypothetical protein JNJ44_07645 [Zoogloeaceae bacterium]|nr:hypothetical protein [Zoogloeaceae bacterium]